MRNEEYWKNRCLELAKVVNRLRIHRMHEDRLLAYKIAKKILEDNKGMKGHRLTNKGNSFSKVP